MFFILQYRCVFSLIIVYSLKYMCFLNKCFVELLILHSVYLLQYMCILLSLQVYHTFSMHLFYFQYLLYYLLYFFLLGICFYYVHVFFYIICVLILYY